MRRRIAKGCVIAAVLGSSLALGACKRKDPQKCQEALATARRGAESGQFDAVSRWRDYAYKQCADPTALQKLDQDIVAKREAIAKAKREREAREAETKSLLDLFVSFIGDNRQNPGKSTTSIRCGKNETKPDEVWCKGARWVNRDKQLKFDVRYWKAAPAAAHWRTRTLGTVACEAVGKGKKVGAAGGRTRCRISGGRLKGLQALITKTEKQTVVEVFSKAYLERDSRLAARVR